MSFQVYLIYIYIYNVQINTIKLDIRYLFFNKFHKATLEKAEYSNVFSLNIMAAVIKMMNLLDLYIYRK
jgi:hypothetical protein